jgi:hypothetical protein
MVSFAPKLLSTVFKPLAAMTNPPPMHVAHATTATNPATAKPLRTRFMRPTLKDSARQQT